MLVKRLSWHGFVAFDHTVLLPYALAALRGLHAAGKLVSHDQVLDGLEHAPRAPSGCFITGVASVSDRKAEADAAIQFRQPGVWRRLARTEAPH
jgi:hypothetical protein